MQKSWIVCCLLAGAAVAAIGADLGSLGLKPGLWEVKLVKQVLDGHDNSAQMAAAMARLQAAMASLPTEQRARMEAMMKQNGLGAGSNGSFRICVSPEMAKRDTPVIDKDGRCQPATVTHSGAQTSFQFSCTTNGVMTSGKGTATVAGNTISTHTDVTTHGANGTVHTMQNDSEMTYVGTDCGDIKPPQLPAATH